MSLTCILMWLIFSSLSASGAVYTHNLYCSDLEGHFDVLNSFVAAGYRLLSAFVVDEGQWINLPLEAFDGQSVNSSLQALQEQYQRVLSP